ncbi:MAG TPA: type II toxin-antitoxin system VapC family toxin [Anaerolineae bacterium]|nr:type II toxin-antitoxin system VapC family toxin [Anaerolineae bacterium]HQH38915.1 type II toxin-antitoxin system VapC family toxin [Anaerolineae bacterium]
MIVDTSAIVAIFFKESGYEGLLQKLGRAHAVGIGAPTLVECGIVLSARLGRDARGMLSRFLAENDAFIIPFTDAHYSTAVTAWLKFGKGRHPAALNFGDCLTYAVAKLAGGPLLCVGDDFSQTDLELA